MAKLIYHIAVTVDNFITDLDGTADDSTFLYEGEPGPFKELIMFTGRAYDIHVSILKSIRDKKAGENGLEELTCESSIKKGRTSDDGES